MSWTNLFDVVFPPLESEHSITLCLARTDVPALSAHSRPTKSPAGLTPQAVPLVLFFPPMTWGPGPFLGLHSKVPLAARFYLVVSPSGLNIDRESAAIRIRFPSLLLIKNRLLPSGSLPRIDCGGPFELSKYLPLHFPWDHGNIPAMVQCDLFSPVRKFHRHSPP